MKEFFTAEKITDRITRVIMPGRVFSYIVEGDERAVVIDSGCGLGPFREFVEKQLNGKPYEVILSHGHLDHAGAAIQFNRVWLEEKDWPMAASNSMEARAGYIRSNGMNDFSDNDMDAAKAEGYLPLKYGQIFDLDGEELEIIDFSGHSLGSIGILFKEERILLTGDACCSMALLLSGSGKEVVAAYRDTLTAAWDKYRDCFDRMLYSHPHNVGGPEVIPQMIQICQDIIDDKDDRLTMELFGRTAFIAKDMDQTTMLPKDGTMANLVYSL